MVSATSKSSSTRTRSSSKKDKGERKKDHVQKKERISILEVIFYIVHVLFFFGYLVPTVGGRVRQECEARYQCARYMRMSWLGYAVDLADGQWRDLRGSFPLLWTVLIATTGGHWICQRLWYHWSASSYALGQNRSVTQNASVAAWFRLLVGLIFVYVMHGRHCMIVLLIAFVGYRLTKWQQESNLSRGFGTFITWIFAICVLLFKESYRLQHLPQFRFLRPLFSSEYSGMYRWQLPANFLILRIVSFSFDFYWALDDDKLRASATSTDSAASVGIVGAGSISPVVSRTLKTASVGTTERGKEKKREEDAMTEITEMEETCSNSNSRDSRESRDSHRSRLTKSNLVDQHRPMSDYNLVNYFSYILYTPLYTAGPILSFNAFVENTYNPQKAEDPLRYAGRWILCLLVLEFLTNKFPFFAVISSGLFPHLSPVELAVVCYITLKMMWLKFLITWRFFRLWALADGTLAPENMTRCMSNNNSLETFWRGWHASFNKWIVRYMYKPLGGRAYRLYSVWPIFLFVALWHDMEWKLLAWGLLNGVFFVVEALAKQFADSPLMQSLPHSMFNFICVFSGATYIIVLIAVNLTGYAVGVGGVTLVLNKLLTLNGAKVLVGTYYFLGVAVSLMNFLRKHSFARD